MAASLSAYWVKFFKGAGFPQDVATKHAVVFSNNRIKPDMLPDLDKPSLKEMGITLMGDMIAIVRYAKKVVEDTTCERFLVDSEDPLVRPKTISKPIVKKAFVKVPSKSILPGKVKQKTQDVTKSDKNPLSTVTKMPVKKKPLPSTARVISQYADKEQSPVPLKRKLERQCSEFESDSEDDWNTDTASNGMQKKLKTSSDDNNVGYKVIMPKGTTVRSRKILKKALEQKRTVFDRLGDSSVTSTTNLAETNPTFNITGLGKEIFKRNSNVFNRLGDKDAKRDQLLCTGILKNGTNNSISQGILKNHSARIGTTVTTTNKILNVVRSKPTGTMRADQEKNTVSNSVKQLVKTAKKINFINNMSSTTKVIRKTATSSKLASEQISSVPAKERLGIAGSNAVKQVTFNRIATIAHVQKPGVFSRLGI